MKQINATTRPSCGQVEGNREARTAVRCRRAFALQSLDNQVAALVELEAAALLSPGNQQIRKDLHQLRSSINKGEGTEEGEGEEVEEGNEVEVEEVEEGEEGEKVEEECGEEEAEPSR